jgi:hypothetical protein
MGHRGIVYRPGEVMKLHQLALQLTQKIINH